jgi:hypothetical protein
MVTQEKQPLHLPLASTLSCLHGTSELGKPLADFIGMKVNYILLVHYE